MPWQIVKPVVNLEVRKLCFKPYHNHPKGCPNFAKKKSCPPFLSSIYNIIDLNQSVYVIWTRFNLAAHVAKLRAKYSQWTQRQLECCLYWQPRARKGLQNELRAFLKDHPGLYVEGTPEGAGVDITATMKGIGISLEWPPVNWTYQIALAGTKIVTGI
jgi:hypothetical protein